MKKLIVVLMALCSLATLSPKTYVLNVNPTTKDLKLIDDSDKDQYHEDDYEYDGFLDEVIIGATMKDSEENISFGGQTSEEYGGFSFSLNFDMEDMSYEYDFSESGVNVISDEVYADETGRLETEVLVENPDTGKDELYKVSEFRDLDKLESFLRDPEAYGPSEESEVSTCGFWKNLLKAIAAIVAIYVIVAETAEQIRARINYKFNKELEKSGNGVDKWNYITNQTEENEVGYRSGGYQFGFAYFRDVGCEVASVYNLMIDEGMAPNLSSVIYDFEKFAIEFAVGWGYLGSNPRDIYRYLVNRGIMYSKSDTYIFFKLKVLLSSNGTSFIMSSWNTGLFAGLHTYYFIKKNDHLVTYNFKPAGLPLEFEDLDDLYEETGSFIVGYRIYGLL